MRGPIRFASAAYNARPFSGNGNRRPRRILVGSRARGTRVAKQVPVSDSSVADVPSSDQKALAKTVAPTVAVVNLGIVNVALVATSEAGDWVLVDAGLPGTA